MVAMHYLGAGLIALGAILLGRVALDALRRRALLRDPIHVKGKVVRVRQVEPAAPDSSSMAEQAKYYATVRYRSKDGRWLEKELLPSGDAEKWKVGKVIRLLYQRTSPSNVVEEEQPRVDLVAMAVASLIILAIGIALCLAEQSAPTDAN
jgi:hypothetical protein